MILKFGVSLTGLSEKYVRKREKHDKLLHPEEDGKRPIRKEKNDWYNTERKIFTRGLGSMVFKVSQSEKIWVTSIVKI